MNSTLDAPEGAGQIPQCLSEPNASAGSTDACSATPSYLIASLKHTSKGHEHITFWGPNYRGYVLAITDGHVGRYSAEFIAEDGGHLNDGESCIAVPESEVAKLLSPTPFFANYKGVAVQFYDTPGPVVDNTRANWNRLIATSMPRASDVKPQPEVFRGKRRSFAIDSLSVVQATEATS